VTSSPIRRKTPPQEGRVQGTGWVTSSPGRCSGNGRRAGFCASVASSIRRRRDRRGRSEPLGLVRFQRLDRQLELLGVARQFRRRATELGAPVSRQLEAQFGDLRLGGDRVLHHRGDDPLQGVEIIGQLIRRDRHPIIESRPRPFDAT